ncbi:MAG: tetratricopeptide repeat protein [Planctomycetes bacterium]|nr:tetratricopeptide repeat protein [Planctomycetota bacterium]
MSAYRKIALTVAFVASGFVAGACASSKQVRQGNEELSIKADAYYEALSHTDNGRYFEAIQSWKVVLEDEPRFALGHFNIGQVYDQLNLVPEAIEHYEQAAQLDPGVGRYNLHLGTAYLRANLTKEAVQTLEKAAEQDPYNPQLHYNLAAAYMTQKNFDSALMHTDIAVDLASVPDARNESGLAKSVDRAQLARYLARQAECHIERGEFDKAGECVKRIEQQCKAEVPADLRARLDDAPKPEAAEGNNG